MANTMESENKSRAVGDALIIGYVESDETKLAM